MSTIDLFFWVWSLSLWYYIYLLWKSYYKIRALGLDRPYQGTIREWREGEMHNAIAWVPIPLFWIEDMNEEQVKVHKDRNKKIIQFWLSVVLGMIFLSFTIS